MKVLVFAGFSKSLVHFRKELLERMVHNGHQVIAVGPENDYKSELNDIGVEFIQLKFNRLAMNPVKDLKLIVQLVKLIKLEKPDLYFGYTIKPVIYGTIAAKIAGVKNRYSMVTGVGSLFIESNSKMKIIRYIAQHLYKIGLRLSHKTFFQNNDDIVDFVSMNLIAQEKCVLINGSGVNLEIYSPSLLPPEDIFLFVGSLTGDKGIREYIEAAKIVKQEKSHAKFWIVGPLDKRISAITETELNEFISNKTVEYFGEVRNVKSFIDKCRYFVLPSYREGTPRSVLEAMAKGRAIITTDAPGCKETVEDGYNGFLVPVKDSQILAEKMLWMIENPAKIHEMSQNSLSLVRRKYDVNIINKVMLTTMKLET